MIIGNPEEDELVEAVSKLEKTLDREINYHVFGRKQFGDTIKKADSFVASVMRGSKIFIIGDEKQIPRIHK